MHAALLRNASPARRRTAIAVHSAPQLRAAWQSNRTTAALDLRPLNRVLRLDQGRGLLEVHAGARWDDIDAWLAASPEAQSAWSRPASKDGSSAATVNESIARNAPGYGPTQGAIADDIEALTLLAADGELHRLSRSSEPGLFRLVLGGHGLFGLIYSVTLRLVPWAATPRQETAMPDLLTPLDPCDEPALDASVHASVCATAALFVPSDRAGRFLLHAIDAAHEHRVVVARASASRVIDTETAFLHPKATDRVEISLQLCRSANLCARVRLEEACRRLALLALEQGGGLSLSHGTYASRDQVEASYPMIAGFLAEKHRHDPAGHFNNAWSRHYTQLLRREACAMRWAA